MTIRSKKVKECIEWGISLVISLCVTLFILEYVCFLATVPTGSMIPTINIGDKLVVLKCMRYFDPDTHGLTYGDMVVFKYKDDVQVLKEELLVKRVIGLPGDKISIDNGVVYRNGKPLTEEYVKNKDSFFMNELTVPPDEMFVLGDNRAGSYDSRYWPIQTVSLDSVEGEVLFVL